MKLLKFFMASTFFAALSFNTMGYVYIQNRSKDPIYFVYVGYSLGRNYAHSQHDIPGTPSDRPYPHAYYIEEGANSWDCKHGSGHGQYVCLNYHGNSEIRIYVPTNEEDSTTIKTDDGKIWRQTKMVDDGLDNYHWYFWDGANFYRWDDKPEPGRRVPL